MQLLECTGTVFTQCPWMPEKGAGSLELEYRQLNCLMKELGIKCGSSTRAAVVLTERSLQPLKHSS